MKKNSNNGGVKKSDAKKQKPQRVSNFQPRERKREEFAKVNGACLFIASRLASAN